MGASCCDRHWGTGVDKSRPVPDLMARETSLILTTNLGSFNIPILQIGKQAGRGQGTRPEAQRGSETQHCPLPKFICIAPPHLLSSKMGKTSGCRRLGLLQLSRPSHATVSWNQRENQEPECCRISQRPQNPVGSRLKVGSPESPTLALCTRLYRIPLLSLYSLCQIRGVFEKTRRRVFHSPFRTR